MKKRILLTFTGFLFVVSGIAQRDSILGLSDLNFHSTLEKQSFVHFSQFQTDTLNAFLAVNELLSDEDRVYLSQKFENLYQELLDKKIVRMKVNAQIKLIQSTLKNNCLKTYAREDFLSSTLLNGRYNEISAAVLTSLLFDRLHIAYQIIGTYDRHYLIANPGAEEVRLELNDPKQILPETNPEYKDDYVKFLHKIGAVTDAEINSHSTTELYDARSKEEHVVRLDELLAEAYFIRSNKAQALNETDKSLILIEKAYYLYPAPKIQFRYRSCLWMKLNQQSIEKTKDIDYLIRQYKVGKLTVDETVSEFNEKISRLMQFTDKEMLCDSIYAHMKSNLHDTLLTKELDFAYHLTRINQKAPGFEDIRRLDIAATIKPNIKNLNNYMETLLRINLYKINSKQVRMDTVLSLTKQLTSPIAQESLRSWYYSCLLDLAQEAYKNKQPTEGEKYLQTFEKACPPPIGNDVFRQEVERAFRAIAISVYWNTNQNILANHNMVRRGLIYAPDSELIKSAYYEKSEVKYAPVGGKVTPNESEKSTPKTGRTIRVLSKDKKDKVYTF